jgi:hypothetical protein
MARAPVREDPLVELMRAAGQPVTRQNWIDLAYGVDVPSPWTALEECELPEELQDWSQVKMED